MSVDQASVADAVAYTRNRLGPEPNRFGRSSWVEEAATTLHRRLAPHGHVRRAPTSGPCLDCRASITAYLRPPSSPGPVANGLAEPVGSSPGAALVPTATADGPGEPRPTD